MTYRLSDETFNAQLALSEAKGNLDQEQDASLELADRSSVELILARQFHKLRKSSRELKGLQRKSKKLVKSQAKLDKHMAEAERRHQRKLKQAKRDMYYWASLAD
jgi:hypothetical protein